MLFKFTKIESEKEKDFNQLSICFCFFFLRIIEYSTNTTTNKII